MTESAIIQVCLPLAPIRCHLISREIFLPFVKSWNNPDHWWLTLKERGEEKSRIEEANRRGSKPVIHPIKGRFECLKAKSNQLYWTEIFGVNHNHNIFYRDISQSIWSSVNWAFLASTFGTSPLSHSQCLRLQSCLRLPFLPIFASYRAIDWIVLTQLRPDRCDRCEAGAGLGWRSRASPSSAAGCAEWIGPCDRCAHALTHCLSADWLR